MAGIVGMRTCVPAGTTLGHLRPAIIHHLAEARSRHSAHARHLHGRQHGLITWANTWSHRWKNTYSTASLSLARSKSTNCRSDRRSILCQYLAAIHQTIKVKFIRDAYSTPPSIRPWQFLYFLPEPQGHGSLRPTFFSTRIGWVTSRCCVWLCDYESRSLRCSRSLERSTASLWRLRRLPVSCWAISAHIRNEMTSSLVFSIIALNRLYDSSL